MKRYIIFCLSLLMAFPFAASAQDEADEAEETGVRSFTVKKKQYETREVRGLVIDATTQQPVAGAIVRAAEIDGYSTLTEDDGTYTLKVPVFSTALYFVSPDYNAVRIGLIDGEQQRAAQLYPATFSPDYSAVTSARKDYEANDFKYSNMVNVKEEIQKQLGAQVHTINRSGLPGVGSVMFMQGLNSLNVNAQPLIVIDGVIIEQQYNRSMLHDGYFNDILSNLNSEDIERVTVVRNGTALYGAKGANGVILIDTRRNKSMATRITATISGGFTMEPKYMEMMDAEQYRNYASDMLSSTNTLLNKFKFLNDTPYQDAAGNITNYYYTQYHNNTDWKKFVYDEAFQQKYGINVEGGDNVANYNLSVGYISNESSMKYNSMNRLNIRFNTDITLTKMLAVRFDASFGNTTRDLRDDGAPSGYDDGTIVAPSFLAYAKSPFLSPYSYGMGQLSNSVYDITEEDYLKEALANYSNYNWKLGNPAAINEYGEAPNKNHFENSMLNLAITPKLTINPNLYVQEHFSYNLVNTNEKRYLPINGTPSYYVASLGIYKDNEISSMASKQNSVQSDTRIDWHNRYNAHAWHVFGGARINWETYTNNTLLGYNTGNDKTPKLGNTNDKKASGVNEKWNSLAWYAQAEYNYMTRYYLQANVTLEGSSLFGKDGGDINMFGAAWGLFPGIQGSWVLTNEKWLSDVKGIDYLRLTAGYDISGNDNIDYYAARSYFTTSRFMNTPAALSFEGIGNTKIQWETTRRFNAGIEGHFINNRLALNLNYFRSNTDNLLTRQSLGFMSGIAYNWSNGGKLRNEGFDVTASAKLIARHNWQWQLGASMGHYKNEITALPDGDKAIETTVLGGTVLTKVGEAANVFYGYKTDGVYATTEEALDATKGGALAIKAENGDLVGFGAGDVRFVDLYNDPANPGVINEDDRTIIGDPNPDIYGNIFSTLAYKRFKLDVNFTYSLGNDVYNYMRQQLESGSRFMNQTTAMLSRWQAEGQQTSMPRATFQDPMGNARFSDRWIEDGSYLRLKTVTLSYDLPLQSEFIQGLQVWIQANNVFTLTRYLGSDPEFSMTSNVLGQGIDAGLLGQTRSFVAGVKINL